MLKKGFAIKAGQIRTTNNDRQMLQKGKSHYRLKRIPKRR